MDLSLQCNAFLCQDLDLCLNLDLDLGPDLHMFLDLPESLVFWTTLRAPRDVLGQHKRKRLSIAGISHTIWEYISRFNGTHAPSCFDGSTMERHTMSSQREIF